MKIRLSIIILNYHCAALTEKCLQSILRFHPGEEYEVIVVDNESQTDEILSLQKRYGDHRNISFIYSPRNIGYGRGNELGITVARGEYILVLNPDIEVFDGTLNAMVRYMDRHRDIGILAPQLIYDNGAIQDSYRQFPRLLDVIVKRTPLRFLPFFRRRMNNFLMRYKDPHTIEDVDWVVGAAMMMRREALQDTRGAFDPRYFLFFEDTDLCRRMWEQGWRVVYFPEARALHHHERLSDGGFQDIFRKKTVRIHIASALKYFWKYLFRRVPR